MLFASLRLLPAINYQPGRSKFLFLNSVPNFTLVVYHFAEDLEFVRASTSLPSSVALKYSTKKNALGHDAYNSSVTTLTTTALRGKPRTGAPSRKRLLNLDSIRWRTKCQIVASGAATTLEDEIK